MVRGTAWLGLVGVLAIGALAVAGAGCGGGVCGNYCDIGIKCVELVCEPSDPDAYKGACQDSCNAGFEALSPSEEGPVKDCLQCFTNALNESGTCGSEAFLTTCQDKCSSAEAASGLQKWGDAASKSE